MNGSGKNQRQRILDLLLSVHGGEVPSMALSRISLQYGARVKELRGMGFRISNRTERRGGKVYGYFSLGRAPAPGPNPSNPEMRDGTLPAGPSVFPEFGSLARESYGVD
jgi:hypothetical protein